MNAFEELFYINPYQKSFCAKVLSCKQTAKGYAVILSDTAFYPEGGGQPADHGTLDGKEVMDVKRVNGNVTHYLKEPLEENSLVEGEIDWNRRYDHMVQHTAEHIVSGLIHQKFGYENIGFHMGETTTLIDFDGLLNAEEVKEIEMQSNAVISDGRELRVFYPSKEELTSLSYRSKKEIEGQVRLVEIPGCDVCACCGTHVKNTVECKIIKIWNLTVKGKGIRLEISAGNRAIEQLCLIENENRKISHLLSAEPFHTAIAVEKLLEEKQEETMQKNAWIRRHLSLWIQNCAMQNFNIQTVEEMDISLMKEFAKGMIEQQKAFVSVVLSKAERGYRYVVMSECTDLREPVREWNAKLHGKGGGKADLVQGFFEADESEIRTLLKDTLSMVKYPKR